ncbi:MAG: SdpI family protein, partial [Bifidobacterium sp.]|nr:SdpI family protein [Bifidobacterium sp.]
MILGILLLFLAVAILGVALAALRQKLPGNSVIGIRVPEVRRDPELWALAHRVAAPSWIVASVAAALGGVIAFNASGWGWGWVAVAVIATLVMIGVGSAMGAHTVAVVDAQRQAAADADGCGCG